MYPNLKLQIFRLGIHQNRLAKTLGIDETILSKIIHGYREPSHRQRELLASFLAVEEGWLFEKYEAVSRAQSTMAAQEEKGFDDGKS